VKRLGLILLLGASLVPLAADALERPGGGQSFSGGGFRSSGGGYSGGGFRSSSSWSSSSGSGGGDGEVSIGALLLMVFLCGVGVTILVNIDRNTFRNDSWDSGGATYHPLSTRANYDPIRAADPEFSAALFEDFVYALYARAHTARHDLATLDSLAGYLTPAVRQALHERHPSGVPTNGVIVGSAFPERVVALDDKLVVDLVIESNFTAGARTYYLRECWTLERAASARTRPPAGTYAFNCPSCGAAFRSTQDGRCVQCGQLTCDGRFDWSLTQIRRLNQEDGPPALTSDVDEVGTDDPTRIDPNAHVAMAELTSADPSASLARVEQRLGAIYHALNAAWNAEDLARARPYVSDSMYNYLAYWLTAYRSQGLKNTLTRAAIGRIELAKVVRDRHFDAVTLRFWASGLDLTVARAKGQRVAGSDKWPRKYSEYWTLIRGAGVRGAPERDDRCPNCGAASRVNMAGSCEHCGSHLTRGEFDWVLSKIEQDEAYVG